MIDNIELLEIKKIILDTIPDFDVEKIILLAPDATDDSVLKSDYDLLIIVRNKLSKEKIQDTLTKLYKAFFLEQLKVDILLKERSEIDFYMNEMGDIMKKTLEQGTILYDG